jgi:hypothetical protein
VSEAVTGVEQQRRRCLADDGVGWASVDAAVANTIDVEPPHPCYTVRFDSAPVGGDENLRDESALLRIDTDGAERLLDEAFEIVLRDARNRFQHGVDPSSRFPASP